MGAAGKDLAENVAQVYAEVVASTSGRDVKCPYCAAELKGSDLEKLVCPKCGKRLPSKA